MPHLGHDLQNCVESSQLRLSDTALLGLDSSNFNLHFSQNVLLFDEPFSTTNLLHCVQYRLKPVKLKIYFTIILKIYNSVRVDESVTGL